MGKDWLMFERNMPFKFSKAAHMNTQIIELPSMNDLEHRVSKLVNAFTRQGSAKFVQLERGVTLRDHFGGDVSKNFFYLEVPGLRTANGRLKTRFAYEIG